MITRKQIEREIKKESSFDVTIQIGEGYYYFTSEDEATQDIFDKAYTASVCTYRLNYLTMNQWVESFKAIINK